MTNVPKISIVTASYNSEHTIEATIKSVLSQSYDNIEYIIIDGYSTDNTRPIIEQYIDEVDIFICEPDGGIYSAWNKGIKKSTGDYVFILNSDDTLYDENVIKDVVNFLVDNGDALVVYAKLIAYEPETGYSYVDGRPTCLGDFLHKMHYCTLTAFVSRRAYEEIGLYREDYRISSDYDWAIKLFKKIDNDRLMFYDRVILKFSVDGCSNANYRLAFEEIRSIIKEHFPFTDYCRHILYVKILVLKKMLIPYVSMVGLLGLWRKWKTEAH